MSKVSVPLILAVATMTAVLQAQQAKLSTNEDQPPIHRLGGQPAPSANSRQNKPNKIIPTHAVIVHEPILLDPSDTGVTVEWSTDTPSTGKVLYGEGKLDHSEEAATNGLVAVGTLHRVYLKGLKPGKTYRYKVVSTRVVELKAYHPDLGEDVTGREHRFTTFDTAKQTVSFNTITDTHGIPSRVQAVARLIDWRKTDFFVHTGDSLDSVESENQLYQSLLDPLTEMLHGEKPLIFVRGNHDLRGPFARSLQNYLADENERFYFSRDDGPLHLTVVDTAEDKPDDTKEYSGLVRQGAYRNEELTWFEHDLQDNVNAKSAPFRVVVMHQPDWGWLDGKNNDWTKVANAGKVDLVIAGHFHTFIHFAKGVSNNNFEVLTIAPDQTAHVEVTHNNLHVTVVNSDGSIADDFTLPKRAD